MRERIKEIIKAEHLSDGEFADLVGIKRSTLSHCLGGRNDVSKDIITKIHNIYPYISINWLMFGEGDSGLYDKSEGLFDNSNSEPYLRSITNETSEYDKENDLNSAENKPETPITEEIKTENMPIIEIRERINPGKKIDKIMVFYDDNTFEVFKSK